MSSNEVQKWKEFLVLRGIVGVVLSEVLRATSDLQQMFIMLAFEAQSKESPIIYLYSCRKFGGSHLQWSMNAIFQI